MNSRLLKTKGTFLLLLLVLAASCAREQDKSGQNSTLSHVKQIVKKNPKAHYTHDEDGRTMLHDAVVKNQFESARFLINEGADLGAKDKYGYTPMHLAVKSEYTEMVHLLIDSGADVNAKTDYGYTPLHWAVLRNNNELTTMLRHKGADIWARDRDGNTALQLAINEDYLSISELLLPLHEAVKNGDVELCTALIGEEPEFLKTKDYFGRTLLHKAMEFNHTKIVALLTKSGADKEAKDNFGNRPFYYNEINQSKRTGVNLLDSGVVEKVENAIYDRLHRFEHLEVGLLSEGKVVFTRAYAKGKISQHYVYGSTSKAVTATVIMQLLKQGKIKNLDDNIWEYSSRYTNCMPAKYADSPLTFKHLLSHTSGLPFRFKTPTRNSKLKFNSRPGEKFSYSSWGYGILGHLIEAITGLSYSSAVNKYVGNPVGAASFHAEKIFQSPGARVHSTIADMARFADGILNNVYFTENQFYNQIIQPQPNGLINKGLGYGLGFQFRDLDSDSMTVFHAGANATRRAHLLLLPGKKIGVVLLGKKKKTDLIEITTLGKELIAILKSR